MGELTVDLLVVGEVTILVAFATLVVIALARAPRLGAAGWWAAAAFASVAAGLVVSSLPDWVGASSSPAGKTLGLLLLLGFPYLMFRFAGSFGPFSFGVESLAAAAVIASILSVLVSAQDVEGAAAVAAWVLLVLAYWSTVSTVAVVRLWRAAAGLSGIARRRVRLMAVGVAVLAVALLLTAGVGGAAPVSVLLVQLLALASAVGFGLGLNPPAPLRMWWRSRLEGLLAALTGTIMQIETRDALMTAVLPPVSRLMGSTGAAMVDRDGVVLASHGDAPPPGTTTEGHDAGRGVVRAVEPLSPGQGSLVVWTSPYTTFFGRDELALLRNAAAVTGLGLQRCDLLEEERRQRDELERARQEAVEARRQADTANQAKSEFLSRMSHELRTPLNAILGFAQLLEAADLAEEDRESVEHILKAGRHLTGLITDVLDLSRVEAGRLTVSLEPVHAGDLIRDSIALIRPLADDRSIRVDLERAGCDTYVFTDRQRCRQALLNLLSNAVKYNRDDGRVDVTCVLVDATTLRIAVSDTGPGIDAERQQRLFEPFDRLGAEGSGIEGTGLGLALTKHLAERLGGGLGLHSEPGRGSTFWLELPVTEPHTSPDTPPVPSEGRDVAAGRRLLLVEDNLASLRLVEAFLRLRPGIAVVPAMQGRIALDLAYQHRPDLIVLDLHLPDLSGREVLTRLKADPRTCDIPVVVTSADASPGRIQQLRDDGAFDYVTKPLDLRKFLAVVDAATGDG